MAAVQSLGVHMPVALSCLIAEGILPPSPSTDQYQWETYDVEDEDGGENVEEEILATKTAVVWSQGSFIRNVYRFDLEAEEVVQAVLTRFPTSIKHSAEDSAKSLNNSLPSSRTLRHSRPKAGDISTVTPTEVLTRALVVLLRTKAHVFFCKGPVHIVDLPFEVERAFPAPRGLVLQRKRTVQHTPPPTPQIPTAPPNSFFSSQGTNLSTLSTLGQPLSPTMRKSLAKTSFSRTKPLKPSSLGVDSKLDALFQEVIATPGQRGDDDITNLYTLSDPLSDLGVITYSLLRHKPRIHGKSQNGFNVEFESLGPAEQVIYVSVKDELSGMSTSSSGPLILIVTFNADINTITLWHAWYVKERSLKEVFKMRADQKDSKARRRSSFMSTAMGTGATTPVVRRRDGTRESLVATNFFPGEQMFSQGNVGSGKTAKQHGEEEVMASQMDPEYRPVGSQPLMRENRRISSINADVRASQTTVTASFGGTGGRRATSFGGTQGRRSLSHRKSRGSTPGSSYGHSLEGGEDSMDIDTTLEIDSEESTDEVLRQIRATFESPGMDSVLGNAEEDFKRELIVRKIHSLSVGLSGSSQGVSTSSATAYKVVTLAEPPSLQNGTDAKLRIYIYDRSSSEVQHITIKVKNRLLWPSERASIAVAIPQLILDGRVDTCEDILKLHHHKLTAVLLGARGVHFSLDQQISSRVPTGAPYRAYHPRDFMQYGYTNKEFGKSRLLATPSSPLVLQHPGPEATFDEISQDGTYHRRKLVLRPSDDRIDAILAICELVLPKSQSHAVRRHWCLAFARLNERPNIFMSTQVDIEFLALVTMMFMFVIDMLNPKALATLNIMKVALGETKAAAGAASRLHHAQADRRLSASSAWSWMFQQGSPAAERSPGSKSKRKDQFLVIAAALADELRPSAMEASSYDHSPSTITRCAIQIMLSLHIFREERKLCTLHLEHELTLILSPVIAQFGCWLGLEDWSYGHGTYYNSEGAGEDKWAFVKFKAPSSPQLGLLQRPVGVYQWFEHSMKHASSERFPSLTSVAEIDTGVRVSGANDKLTSVFTPRITALYEMMAATNGFTASPQRIVEAMINKDLSADILETLPESIAAPFKDAISRCEKEPPTTWSAELLQFIRRGELNVQKEGHMPPASRVQPNAVGTTRDVHSACVGLEHLSLPVKSKEANRHSISQLIFNDDRRLVEAISLMHFNSVQVAQCPKQPDWDDAMHFEHQRRVMHWVTIRMIALPTGDGMIHYDSQTPLLTEKYHLPGFNSSCLMQPMGHTLTADRSGLTEEKVNWAYFHAGVSSGIRISHKLEGIDTSWIAFNKPNELTNRHAGLLLALGLSGHLRHLAKWLSFKYLTPKHTMTSVGLLLGLSASYLGTMDGLITRMLSVHITRMLPAGAAELNVSPATQTAGLVGIGLLYYNSQHRRMSELMLSELEYMEIEDPDSGPDMLRDESYRLAAGFALGFINLSKGDNLRGLHGLQMAERLLAIAVGPRPVNAVHVFDRATAGAVIAIALIYLKSNDKAVAQKIDIPDTEAQFDHVRPDILMMRAMAKHMILWPGIEAKGVVMGRPGWIQDNLPGCYKARLKQVTERMLSKHTIDSSHIPMFNVFTGLAWALSLRYAGSGNCKARDEILELLKIFQRLSEGADAYYFDGKLGRASLRQCMDILALCAATVMAGSGDLETFRHLRRMHGRTDPDTSYGSHLAAHLAIGTLFLGGGTFTFSTSNLAVASLMCAFYPLFPTDVHDNRVHLQAFRHLWVFAAEARCVVIQDIDTQRPLRMPIIVSMRDGSSKCMQAPCLLPELDTIATVQTDNPAYWRVTLDFANNPAHLASFRKDQYVFVRRCPAAEAHTSVFSASLAALNDSQNSQKAAQEVWHTLSKLSAFADMEKADMELLLPPDAHSSVYMDERGTVVDDRLVLHHAVWSNDRNALWNLRILLAWAEKRRREGDKQIRWLGQDFVEALKARLEERVRTVR